jgi:hypothetical protein
MKVVFGCPTVTRPYQGLIDAMYAEIPLLDAAGIEHEMTWEIGCPYISHARSMLLHKARKAEADVVVFLDHDLSWKPGDLLKLIQTPGNVVCGTYRFKKEPETYMGTWRRAEDGRPLLRGDGCVRGEWIPAGFLKVTMEAVDAFMAEYPGLVYGDKDEPHVDLFNHGAHDGIWFGEDFAFSRRWNELGGDIWIIPDLDLTHHAADGTAYHGNFHEWLLRQPGGSKDPARAPALSAA